MTLTIIVAGMLASNPSNEVREKLEKYADILRIRPSAIAGLVLEDCIEYWVKQYS